MKTTGLRVTVVVENQGSILLIKEKRSSREGYSLPGGQIEFLETIAEAARREVWEETGLLVEMERLLWVDDRIDHAGEGKHTVGIGVLARLVGEQTEPIPGGLEDEQIEWAGWVPLEEWRTLASLQGKVKNLVWGALSEADYSPDYHGNVWEAQES